MSGKKQKPSRPTSGQKKHDLGMFGLGMDFDAETGMGDDDDDDDDFEAELAALRGNQPKKKATKPKPKTMALSDIDQLAANCMKDIDDISDDDFEDDADLLAELEGLTPMESINASLDNTPELLRTPTSLDEISDKNTEVNVIAERKTMYETAIANAHKVGETSKAKRYQRGLKEIEQMFKVAQGGKPVNMDELPPPVATVPKPSPKPLPKTSSDISEKPLIDFGPDSSVPKVQPEPSSKLPEVPARPAVPQKPATAASESEQPSAKKPSAKQPSATVLKELTLKRNQFKLAARNKNREGDKQQAKKFLLISKEFDVAIKKVEQGEEVDLSQCPSPPPVGVVTKPDQPAPAPRTAVPVEPIQSPPPSADHSSASASQAVGPTPKTVLEALEQRLQKYQEGVDDAKKEGNSGKARRMGRIVKQYQDAIRDYKAKKPLNLAELPVPPGYPPLPADFPPPQQAKTPHQPSTAPAQNPAAAKVPPTHVPSPAAAAKGPAPRGRNEKELAFLINRQKEFKAAALSAKKKGDIQAARKYLTDSKGFDAMIEAARNGLRVDLTKVPASPSVEQTVTSSPEYVVVREEDCTADSSNREEVFASLQESLKKQYEMCKKNHEHYSKLGDIENSKKFERLEQNSKRDYNLLQNAFNHGNPPPRYHYEDRSFTIIRSNTDLGDQDCQLIIVKCINIPLPSGYSKDDMKVYVSYEFPFPNDQPQNGYTEFVKHSINPEFNQTFKLTIDRKNRALARVFRRQGVKFEIKYARGFLKGDKTLGQATVNLALFDNKSDIHECVNLMDPERGRKAIGGKIEVKLRIREPLTDKDVEIMTEKWLVIDAFVVPWNRPISASSSGRVDSQIAGRNTKSDNVR